MPRDASVPLPWLLPRLPGLLFVTPFLSIHLRRWCPPHLLRLLSSDHHLGRVTPRISQTSQKYQTANGISKRCSTWPRPPPCLHTNCLTAPLIFSWVQCLLEAASTPCLAPRGRLCRDYSPIFISGGGGFLLCGEEGQVAATLH